MNFHKNIGPNVTITIFSNKNIGPNVTITVFFNGMQYVEIGH